MLGVSITTGGLSTLQRVLLGGVGEAGQEVLQDSLTTGIEHSTGVTPVTLEQFVKQSKASGTLGFLLGGSSAGVGGKLQDRKSLRLAEDPEFRENRARELSMELKKNLSAQLDVEQKVFEDSRQETPSTQAGKAMKKARALVDEMTKAVLDGRSVSDIYRTPAQKEAYVQDVITRMDEAGKRQSKLVAIEELKTLSQELESISKEHEALTKEGEAELEKHADTYKIKKSGEAFRETTRGAKLTAEKKNRKIRLDSVRAKLEKIEEGSTSDEYLKTDKYQKLNSEFNSIEDSISDIELKIKDEFNEFFETYVPDTFQQSFEKTPASKRINDRVAELELRTQEIKLENIAITEKAGLIELSEHLEKSYIRFKVGDITNLRGNDTIKIAKSVLKETTRFEQDKAAEIQSSLNDIIDRMPIPPKDKSALKKSIKGAIKARNQEALDKAVDKIIARGEKFTTKSIINESKKSIKKTLKAFKHGADDKNKPATTDSDLNDAMLLLGKMDRTKDDDDGTRSAKIADMAHEYAKDNELSAYIPLVLDYAEISKGNIKGVRDQDKIETMAEMADRMEFLLKKGYSPDVDFIEKAEENQKAIDDLVSGTDTLMSDTKASETRQGAKFVIQDSFFNAAIETLDTLLVKLGLPANSSMDFIKSSMNARNAKFSRREKIKGLIEASGLKPSDMNDWSHSDTAQPFPTDNGVITLTKGQTIQRLMVLKNDKQREMAMNPKGEMAYTQDTIDQMTDSLSKQEKLFMAGLMDMYASAYDEIAPVFRRMYRHEMPKIENYTPSHKEGDKLLEDMFSLFGDGGVMGEIPHSSLRQRTSTNKKFADLDVNDVFHNYFSAMDHFVHYSEKLKQANAVLSDTTARNAIMQKVGKKGLDRLKTHIDLIRDMNKKSSELKIEALDHFNKVYIVNKLILKPNQMFKQLSSAFGMMEDMPMSEVARRLPFAAKNLLRYRRTLRKHESIANRSKHIDNDYDLLLGRDRMGFLGEDNKFLEFGMKGTTFGDVGAIYIGGGVYMDYLMDTKGMSEKNAIEAVVRKAEESQQSTLLSNMSLMQKDKNPFARTARMFSSSAIALTNMQMKAVANFKNGNITKTELIRKMAIYQVIVPSFYAYISSGMPTDNEEVVQDLLVASMKGNTSAIPLVGGAIEVASIRLVNGMTGGDKKDFGIRDATNPITDAMRIMQKGMKVAFEEDDVKMSEVLEVFAGIADSVVAVGAGNAMNAFEGVVKIASGTTNETVEGFLQTMGYSAKAAEDRVSN